MNSLLIPTLFCPKAWEGMSGHETTRFCSYCKKHVHNLETLTVHERLALLRSSAGSICGRYRIAIRRPAKGREESYARHLLKYGAGVACAGGVLLVLWEMHDRRTRQPYYRAVATFPGFGPDMPADYYDEKRPILVGEIACPELDEPSSESTNPEIPTPYVDLTLPREQVEKLINPLPASTPSEVPVVPIRL